MQPQRHYTHQSYDDSSNTRKSFNIRNQQPFNSLYSPCPFPHFQSFTSPISTKNLHLERLLMLAVQRYTKVKKFTANVDDLQYTAATPRERKHVERKRQWGSEDTEVHREPICGNCITPQQSSVPSRTNLLVVKTTLARHPAMSVWIMPNLFFARTTNHYPLSSVLRFPIGWWSCHFPTLLEVSSY